MLNVLFISGIYNNYDEVCGPGSCDEGWCGECGWEFRINGEIVNSEDVELQPGQGLGFIIPLPDTDGDGKKVYQKIKWTDTQDRWGRW